MPIAYITAWPIPDGVKKEIMEEITRVLHEKTGAPLDKITVLIQEVVPSMWCHGGVLGSDPEFKEKSRRLKYEEKELK